VSVFFHWVFFAVDEVAFAQLESDFERACAVPLPEDTARALDAWRTDYQRFATRVRSDGALYADFLGAFHLAPFEFVAKRLMDDRAYPAVVLERDNLPIDWRGTAKHPAPAVLWSVLDAERADSIPGVLGNLLIPQRGVAQALDAVRKALAVDPEVVAARERTLDLWAAVALDAFMPLPHALEAAASRGSGLLSLSISEYYSSAEQPAGW
jgi:hypothetical protein